MKIKVKTKDLDLAMDYIKSNSLAETIELDVDPGQNAGMVIEFMNKEFKSTKIYLYEAHNNITPDLKVISKLYRTNK